MTTLLEQIKKIPARKSRQNLLTQFNQSELEDVALAWLNGEISYVQISSSLKLKGSQVYNFLSTFLRQSYNSEKLEIKK